MSSYLLACRLCYYRTKSLRLYASHSQLHANGPNRPFGCANLRCTQTFTTFYRFKIHFERNHGDKRDPRNVQHVPDIASVASYQCDVQHCQKVCAGLKQFIGHLKEHVKSKTGVNCPFIKCGKRFDGVAESTFKSHISRHHKELTADCVQDQYILRLGSSNVPAVNSTPTAVTDDDVHCDGENCQNGLPKLSETEMEQLLIRKIAVFVMKLQAKHHVPSSTVQLMLLEFCDVFNHNLSTILEKVSKILSDGNVEDTIVQKVSDSIQGHPLNTALDAKSGPLRSEAARSSFYKHTFNYVQPVAVKLSIPGEPDKFFHYVPIHKTLHALFQDISIEYHLQDFHLHNKSMPTAYCGFLKDFFDGTVCQQSLVFQQNPKCINILLYQDEFELANPLGSAKGKHKLFAIYYTIGNLHANVRSKIDALQLVLLCKHKDLVKYGIHSVLQPLIQDLIHLETEGLDLGAKHGRQIAKVVFVLGDNLGSHTVGGFVESFSGTYFCRYCVATRDSLLTGKCLPEDFDARTPDLYDRAVKQVEQTNIEHFQGVKMNSVFHKLSQFHVCTPGLPPCIGHDLFEGIVPSDLT